jgi:hypothetical protein
MCDIFDMPEQPVGGTDIFDSVQPDPHPAGTDIFDSVQPDPVMPGQPPVPDIYDEMLQLVQMHPGPVPGPDGALPPLLPDMPTPSDVMDNLNTFTTNLIDPNPGYTAHYDDGSNEVVWTPDV